MKIVHSCVRTMVYFRLHPKTAGFFQFFFSLFNKTKKVKQRKNKQTNKQTNNYFNIFD